MVARGLAFDIGKHASERGIVLEENAAHVDQSSHLVRRQVEVSTDTVELLAHPWIGNRLKAQLDHVGHRGM